MRYTFFLLVRTTPAWLALPREKRADIAEDTFASILRKYPGVSARHFDAEAFSGRCTDVVMFETEEPRDYYYALEALRDSVLWTVPYFEVVDVIPAVESGFSEYEQSLSPGPA